MSGERELDDDVLDASPAIPATEAVFVAKAAHELRGALGGIEILASAVADRVEVLGADDAEVAALLHQLATQSARVESMAHQLLDLTRFGEGRADLRRRPVNVARLVDDVVVDALGPAHTVVIDVAEDLTIETDPLALEQIVANLVRNARCHGGAQIVLDGCVHDDQLVLHVVDDGPGVPEQLQARLFEPFVRSSLVEGNGLGLAIVAELAAALRGAVRYEPNEPSGARFSVVLPLR